MRNLAHSIAVVLVVTSAKAYGQDSTKAAVVDTTTISAETIGDAIQSGLQAKRAQALLMGSAASGFKASALRSAKAGHAVIVQGPYDRIATAAAENAQRYMPFTTDSVKPWMKAAIVAIRVEPTAPNDISGDPAPAVKHVVLIPRDGDRTAVQPIAVEPVSREWANLLGGHFETQGVVATFALSAIPKGDFQIVVITSKDEMRYPVGTDELRRIR